MFTLTRMHIVLSIPAHSDTHMTRCCTLQLRSRTGKHIRISYPCVMLNVMVASHNTNNQYQTLVDPAARAYETSSQMSIEFEVDGPYKVMAEI